MPDYKATLIKLLGLEETATDEIINSASSTYQVDILAWKKKVEDENEVLTNRATEATDKLTKADDLLKVAATENKSLIEELVNSDLAKYADVITDDKKDKIKEQLLSNRKGTIEILDSIKKTEKISNRSTPLHNPNKVAQPAPVNGSEEDDKKNEEAVARRVNNRACEIKRVTPSVSFGQAFIMAQGELV